MFRIGLDDGGEPVLCREGETLLGAVRAGRKAGRIVSGCRGGGCGVCKVQVQQGRYRCGQMSRAHVSVEEEAAGFALACKLWPRTDMVVKVMGRITRSDRPKGM